jgi:outer membrane lipoprotein-sorting protein
LNRRISMIFVFLMAAGVACVTPCDSAPTAEEVIKKVQDVYSRHCCFRATFNQLTVNVSMDLNDRFEGIIQVKRPGMIALDVESPEKQKVVIKGKSYTVYFPQDGTASHGEVPPEMNVEHFFGFFANIGALDRNFSIAFPAKSQDEAEKLILLELTDRKNPAGTYRIILGVDKDLFTIRRAIIYDALGNYNRFDLTGIKFLDSLPDVLFEVGPIPLDKLIPSLDALPKQ